MRQYHKQYIGKRSHRDKRLRHVGGEPTATKIGAKKVKVVKAKGGVKKVKIKRAEYINVATAEGIKKAKIITVEKGNNADYTRENIITKGAIVKTDLGLVRVTSRPGQDGTVNGKLMQNEQ